MAVSPLAPFGGGDVAFPYRLAGLIKAGKVVCPRYTGPGIRRQEPLPSLKNELQFTL